MKVNYSIAAKLAGGGIGTTAYNAVYGIFRHGYLNRVFCTSSNRKKIAELPGLPLTATHTSLTDRLPLLSQSKKWQLKDGLHDYLTGLFLPPADIFHGWNGHCLRSLFIAKKKGALTVVERASSHPETYERILKEEYRKWGIKLTPIAAAVKSRLLNELEITDYITTPSDFAYQSMVENGVPEKKLIKLTFGADLTQIKIQSASRRTKFMALFVGQVGVRKGVPYLLEAWKKLNLKDADLYLLGEVEPAADKLLTPYRNLPSVHFKGYTDPWPYFRSANVFVFPSIEEGSALVTYEALGSGVPIITTFNSGSVVADGKEGYIVPIQDSDAIAERIKLLYNNESLREKMSSVAKETGQRYTWQAYGDNLVQAYDRLAK